MLYVDLPLGNDFGWGVLGINLTKALSKLSDIKILRTQLELSDKFDQYILGKYILTDEEVTQSLKEDIIKCPKITNVPYGFPYVNMDNLVSKNIFGKINIGYLVFEHNLIDFDPNFLQTLKDNWDVLVTGSKWCENIIKASGFSNVVTVPHGVDFSIFNDNVAEKEYFNDKFVIFSGGKFEFRKGQDIVLKAYKILQDKYDDVMLINAWHMNMGYCVQTMKQSPHIQFSFNENNFIDFITRTMAENGIDLSRVITLPAQPNNTMAKIYRNSDIGLFPNRCEGSTNMVLMEYMACGKPVIGAYNSGQKDILNENNALLISSERSNKIEFGDKIAAEWDEPSLDETISHLEWAYNNRDKLKETGKKAADFMKKYTWDRTAEGFYYLASIV